MKPKLGVEPEVWNANLSSEKWRAGNINGQMTMTLKRLQLLEGWNPVLAELRMELCVGKG